MFSLSGTSMNRHLFHCPCFTPFYTQNWIKHKTFYTQNWDKLLSHSLEARFLILKYFLHSMLPLSFKLLSVTEFRLKIFSITFSLIKMSVFENKLSCSKNYFIHTYIHNENKLSVGIGLPDFQTYRGVLYHCEWNCSSTRATYWLCHHLHI